MPRYNTAEGFWNSLDQSGGADACWPWLRSKSKSGYGKTFWKGKNWRSHRLAFYLTCGEQPLCVCHHCDNPICCNPSHLFGGTFKDNALDRTRKGRCPVKRGVDTVQARLTDKQILSLRSEYRNGGITQTELGIRYGIHPSYVSQIITGKRWKHLL